MSDSCQNRPACSISDIREAVCIHTKQIEDACIDKDCVEDLRVYLTKCSQKILDTATSARARCAELLNVYIDVSAIPYHQGHYTVDLTFFYRITGEAATGPARPTPIYGFAAFSKRAVLCGGLNCAKTFSSRGEGHCSFGCATPEAVVEAVDPMILAAKVVTVGQCCHPDPALPEIPPAVSQSFDDELALTGEEKRLYVTLGQFSTIRMERDSQLTIPAFDYCVPSKECCDDPGCEEDPCEMFSRIAFPTEAFFPCRQHPRAVTAEGQEDSKDN
ncbi:MAG: hypothetical protein ACI3VX_06475 [Faecousia sp.]